MNNSDAFINSYFAIFDLILGVYFLVGAITGKGGIYKSDLPEKVKPEMDKFLRTFLFIIGPLLIAGAALEYFKVFGRTGSIVMFIIEIIAFVVFVILYKRKYNQLFSKAVNVPKKK
ncbi:MAG: hypothetical protein IKR03_01995 [Clostridia bacterium]|nr:hypothetical protein [Clostridia bacterium]